MNISNSLNVSAVNMNKTEAMEVKSRVQKAINNVINYDVNGMLKYSIKGK